MATTSEKRHKLIEVEIKNLNSILRNVREGTDKQLYCFMAVEPLTEKDSVKSYTNSVMEVF